MTAVERHVSEGQVVTAPEPVMQGTFALYERPDGSMVLAYRTDAGAEGRRVIPAPMVKMGLKMAHKAAEKAERAAQNGHE
jgi:hypothetical protein